MLGDQIYVTFGTDGGNTAKGWQISYELIPGFRDYEWLNLYTQPKKSWSPNTRPDLPSSGVRRNSHAREPVAEIQVEEPEVEVVATIQQVVTTQPPTQPPTTRPTPTQPPTTKASRRKTRPGKKRPSKRPTQVETGDFCTSSCTDLEAISNFCDFDQYIFLQIKKIKQPNKNKPNGVVGGKIIGARTSYKHEGIFKKYQKLGEVGKFLRPCLASVTRPSTLILSKIWSLTTRATFSFPPLIKKNKKLNIRVPCLDCLKKNDVVVFMRTSLLTSKRKLRLVAGEYLRTIASVNDFLGQKVDICGNFF